jgi:deoxyribose-phosphate aldolase
MNLARTIDHTLLRPEATEAEVRRLVAEAAGHGFAAVCIPPVHVPLAAEVLRGSPVAVGTVVGFPLGYVHPEIRRAESRLAVAEGAGELDTVLNLSWLKSGEGQRVLDDLAGWVEAMRRERDGLILKVILETALLTGEEKVRGALLVVEAGADFVKTSTGFAKGGATVEDVSLLARTVAGRIGVKASGGIRDAATARAMIAAGATRLGTSSGVAIVQEEEQGRKGSILDIPPHHGGAQLSSWTREEIMDEMIDRDSEG